MSDTNFWRWAVSLLVPALLAGTVATLITNWLSLRREKSQRRDAFRERQLREFYSPLLAIRMEISARGAFQRKVSSMSDDEWHKLCEKAQESRDPISAYQRMQEEKWPKFERAIDYANKVFREKTLPAYTRMLAVFRDNMWLAEPETLPYFEKLLEFVDGWEQWLEDAVPYEVLKAVDHGEKHLAPFYEHLQEKHEELRSKLAAG